MARLLSARKDHSGAYDHLSELYGLLDKQPSNVTDEDRAGRDLVVTWMRDLGLEITIDATLPKKTKINI